jgi:hypothetical protein
MWAIGSSEGRQLLSSSSTELVIDDDGEPERNDAVEGDRRGSL